MWGQPRDPGRLFSGPLIIQAASFWCNYSHKIINPRPAIFIWSYKNIAAGTQSWPGIKTSTLQGHAPVCPALTFTSQSLAFGGAAGATAQRLRSVPLTASLRERERCIRGGRPRLGHTHRYPPRLLVNPRCDDLMVSEQGRWIRSASLS